MTIHRSPLATFAALVLLLAACGQDPSFKNREDTSGKSANGSAKNPGGSEDTGVNGQGGEGQGGQGQGGEGEVALPGGGGNEWSPDWAGGSAAADQDGDGIPDGDQGAGGNKGDTTTGNTTKNPETMPDIPAADEDDLSALHKCLAQWKNNPFKGTVYNYQRIYASVSVGGIGNAISDSESTDEPYLILVDAGVNVGGAPVYNLMNKNGYYCMKVNVNVLTTLTVNLHCNARLADQRVNVNVGSAQNDTTSAVGVHVLSSVNVNTVRPQGDSCIR